MTQQPPDVVVYTGTNAPDGAALPGPAVDDPAMWWRSEFQPRPEVHVQLWVGGMDVTCDTLASLEISGGRADKMSRPDASTVSLSIRWPAAQKLPAFGDTVHIAGWLPGRKASTFAALFSGNITDLAQEDDILSIVAVDPLRRFSGVYIGDTPWPNEGWDQRIEHVWTALRAAMGTPAWMPATLIPTTIIGGLPGAAGRVVWARDVDRQPGLDLLYSYLDPINAALFFQPDTQWPSPQDPALWKPTIRLRSGLNPFNGWTDPQTVIDACFVSADPFPRLWQNLGVVINEWRIRYKGTPPHPNDQQPDLDAVARADAALYDRYGPRRSEWSTELVDQFLGQPVAYAHDLAAQLLSHTEVPTWSLDQTQVWLVRDLIAGRAAAGDAAWAVVAEGPGQIARYINLGGVQSGFNNAWDIHPGGGWIVEQTRIAWDATGWVVELGCSNPAAYAGNVLGQTAVVIVNPPTDGGAAGVPLQVQVYRPYNHDPVIGGHLTVNGQGNYPVTAETVIVPSGPLSQGDNTITVAYVPLAGQGASQATATITGHTNWVTWDELRTTPTSHWADVPAATTWATARQRNDVTPH